MKKFLSIVITILALISQVKAQNFSIVSLPVADTLYNCSANSVSINTFWGCTNWTFNTTLTSRSPGKINIDLLANDSPICLGVITYPTYQVNLGVLPSGNYTLRARTVGTSQGVMDSVIVNFYVEDCCPNAGFTSSFQVADTSICFGDTIQCTNTSTGTGINYRWYVDGDRLDTTTNFNYVFTDTGLHSIQLVVDSNLYCRRTATQYVRVHQYPELNLASEVKFCPGNSAIISIPNAFDSVLWSTSDTTNSIILSDTGTYSVIVSDIKRCAIQYDTVRAVYLESPQFNLGNDTTLCDSTTLKLSAFYPFSSFKWQDNSTDSTFIVSSAGTYWAEVKYNITKCITSDTIVVGYMACDTGGSGISDAGLGDGIRVGPNPFNDALIVYNEQGIELTLRLFDGTGKLISVQESTEAKIAIQTGTQSSGIYFLSVTANGITRNMTLLKE